MTILVVAGARPQFIKAAALLPKLAGAELVHTGQHRDPRMVETHFAGLGLSAPNFTLDVALDDDRAARLTRMTLRLVDLVRARRPDRLLALSFLHPNNHMLEIEASEVTLGDLRDIMWPRRLFER